MEWLHPVKHTPCKGRRRIQELFQEQCAWVFLHLTTRLSVLVQFNQKQLRIKCWTVYIFMLMEPAFVANLYFMVSHPSLSQAMFEKMDHIHQYETSLAVSYMEIYKDEVYDLLVTRENVSTLSAMSTTVLTLESFRPPNCLSAKMTVAWCSLPISARYLLAASRSSRVFTSGFIPDGCRI